MCLCRTDVACRPRAQIQGFTEQLQRLSDVYVEIEIICLLYIISHVTSWLCSLNQKKKTNARLSIWRQQVMSCELSILSEFGIR